MGTRGTRNEARRGCRTCASRSPRIGNNRRATGIRASCGDALWPLEGPWLLPAGLRRRGATPQPRTRESAGAKPRPVAQRAAHRRPGAAGFSTPQGRLHAGKVTVEVAPAEAFDHYWTPTGRTKRHRLLEVVVRQ